MCSQLPPLPSDPFAVPPIISHLRSSVRCLSLPAAQLAARGCWGKLGWAQVLSLREMLLCEADTLGGVVVMLISKTRLWRWISAWITHLPTKRI